MATSPRQFNDERDLVAQLGIQLFRMLNGDWTCRRRPFKGRVFSGKAVMAMSRSNLIPNSTQERRGDMFVMSWVQQPTSTATESSTSMIC